MVAVKKTGLRSSAIVRKTDGNPEGKGQSGLLLDWRASAPRGVVAKPQRQVLAEFFTTMLILSASFRYRPAAGTANYLYWIDDEWRLSLIAPGEWTKERRAGFAGTCVLQRDMTWTIAPSSLLYKDTPVADAVNRFYNAFAETLDTDVTFEELLPFYVGTLPYYQRLHASGLARSLQATLTLGGQRLGSARRWRRQLPDLKKVLPAPTG